MEDLVVYRSRIGLFASVVCSKGLKSSHKINSRPLQSSTSKQNHKSHKTVDNCVSCNIPVKPPNHQRRLLVYLLCISVICWIEACGQSSCIYSGSGLKYTVWNDVSFPQYHGSFISDQKDDGSNEHSYTPNYKADLKKGQNDGHPTFNVTFSYQYIWNDYTENYIADLKDDQNDGLPILNRTFFYQYIWKDYTPNYTADLNSDQIDGRPTFNGTYSYQYMWKDYTPNYIADLKDDQIDGHPTFNGTLSYQYRWKDYTPNYIADLNDDQNDGHRTFNGTFFYQYMWKDYTPNYTADLNYDQNDGPRTFDGTFFYQYTWKDYKPNYTADLNYDQNDGRPTFNETFFYQYAWKDYTPNYTADLNYDQNDGHPTFNGIFFYQYAWKDYTPNYTADLNYDQNDGRPTFNETFFYQYAWKDYTPNYTADLNYNQNDGHPTCNGTFFYQYAWKVYTPNYTADLNYDQNDGHPTFIGTFPYQYMWKDYTPIPNYTADLNYDQNDGHPTFIGTFPYQYMWKDYTPIPNYTADLNYDQNDGHPTFIGTFPYQYMWKDYTPIPNYTADLNYDQNDGHRTFDGTFFYQFAWKDYTPNYTADLNYYQNDGHPTFNRTFFYQFARKDYTPNYTVDLTYDQNDVHLTFNGTFSYHYMWKDYTPNYIADLNYDQNDGHPTFNGIFSYHYMWKDYTPNYTADLNYDQNDGHPTFDGTFFYQYMWKDYTPNYTADLNYDQNDGHPIFNGTFFYQYMWKDTPNYTADLKDDQNDGHPTFKTVKFLDLVDKRGQNKTLHDGLLEEKGFQAGMCLPASEPAVCTYMSVCRTCAYLIGNKGKHAQNGNPRGHGVSDDPGEAVMIPNVLNLIRERVDVSVGFVRIPAGHGTGFRVGQDMFMTAYHVLSQEIDVLLREILYPLNLQSEETVRDLISKLNVPIQRDIRESLNKTVERAVKQFIDDSATNVPLLIQKLEGFINTEALSQHLTMRWKENCRVEFVNHGKFYIDWRIQFGEKNRDIVIVKLLETRTGQDFPRALLLDGNYRQHGNIHVVRYINEDSRPQVVVDQATQVIQNDEEAQIKVTEAVEWWKDKFPDTDEGYFCRQYEECGTAVNDDTGRVIIRASESFLPGSSGSPVVYLFNQTRLPVVTMIYQRGFPEFYYKEKERFEDLQVDSKCFFEGGTTMKKLAALLDVHGKTYLKDEIFSQPAVPSDDDQRNINVATEGLSRDVGNIQSQQRAMGDEVRALREDVDILAQHAAGFGAAETVHSRDTAASSHNKMPSVDMEATVKVWEANDKLCYETKGIKDVVQRISSDEHSYICVVGEPGSGKSIAIRHAALYLKDKCGFTVYPVLGPKQFLDYLDRDKRQAFVIDDYLGEYFLDQDKLKVWNNHIEKIKNCLQVHKNTKFLFSLRIQLYSELKSKGNAPMCNDQRHVINFSEKEYKLNRDTMKAMLHHYLQVKHVQNIEGLIGRVRWGKTEQFAGCFPLLCKVFSEDESVRVNPEKYFSDPLPVLQNIFKRIQSENKHQFCGLLLCGITELKDEYFSPLSELKKPKHFNILIKSQKLNPETDLEDIKQALDNLDGVYISHMGNRYTFLHSIFQNIVTFLYDDKYYVFKYATLDFIHERVRLFSKFDTDDDYVKVFYGDDCVELLVDRMIEELLSDDTYMSGYRERVRFIVKSHYIDNKELITCLMEKLFDSEHTRITQDKIDKLFGKCLYAVCYYTRSHPHTDETSCPQYQLLLSLIARCDCNRWIEGWGWMYPLHISVFNGLLHVTKALVEHQADVNVVGRYNCCVLHLALYCRNKVDMTKYLLSLPNLKCLNHRDNEGHTPYWYVVNNKQLLSLYSVSHRDELIQLYKHKAAIL